jgi:hypothetical protein
MFDTARQSCHMSGDDNGFRRSGSISHKPQEGTLRIMARSALGGYWIIHSWNLA